MFIHRRVGWSKEPPNDALVSMWIVQVRSFRAFEKKVFSLGRVNIRKIPKDAENIERERKCEESFCVEGGGDSQHFNYHGWGLGCCHYVTHINEEDRSSPRPLCVIHLVQRYDEYGENCYVLQGGIYIASNVAHSTKVWDCRVDASEVGRFNLT